MKSRPIIRGLFVIAALYDGLLGVAFLVAAPRLFEWLDIRPPNHWGYVHFASLLLVVFAAMFVSVARDPVRNRNLIPYGIMLKVAYAGTVFYHWATGGLPTPWKPFAFIDLAFIAVFAWAYAGLGRAQRAR